MNGFREGAALPPLARVLPEGRRLDLEAAASAISAEDFEGRVLPFDLEAAVAPLLRRERGHPHSQLFGEMRSPPSSIRGGPGPGRFGSEAG